MIERIIDWSASNRFLVFLGTIFAVGWGVYAVANIPLDAVPDLSDPDLAAHPEAADPGTGELFCGHDLSDLCHRHR